MRWRRRGYRECRARRQPEARRCEVRLPAQGRVESRLWGHSVEAEVGIVPGSGQMKLGGERQLLGMECAAGARATERAAASRGGQRVIHRERVDRGLPIYSAAKGTGLAARTAGPRAVSGRCGGSRAAPCNPCRCCPTQRWSGTGGCAAPLCSPPPCTWGAREGGVGWRLMSSGGLVGLSALGRPQHAPRSRPGQQQPPGPHLGNLAMAWPMEERISMMRCARLAGSILCVVALVASYTSDAGWLNSSSRNLLPSLGGCVDT